MDSVQVAIGFIIGTIDDWVVSVADRVADVAADPLSMVGVVVIPVLVIIICVAADKLN
jgi:hypothetical protein